VSFSPERGRTAVGPGQDLGAVVGRVHDDRVLGDPQLVEEVEQLAVVLDVATTELAAAETKKSAM
jgi:hypothetical protein